LAKREVLIDTAVAVVVEVVTSLVRGLHSLVAHQPPTLAACAPRRADARQSGLASGAPAGVAIIYVPIAVVIAAIALLGVRPPLTSALTKRAAAAGLAPFAALPKPGHTRSIPVTGLGVGDPKITRAGLVRVAIAVLVEAITASASRIQRAVTHLG
jgi:hypothetical protein